MHAPALRIGVPTVDAKKPARGGLSCFGKSLTCNDSLFGSPTWARTRDLRINSPSLYRLSYRGTAREYIGSRSRSERERRDQPLITPAIAFATASMFPLFSAARQMRPVPTA